MPGVPVHRLALHFFRESLSALVGTAGDRELRTFAVEREGDRAGNAAGAEQHHGELAELRDRAVAGALREVSLERIDRGRVVGIRGRKLAVGEPNERVRGLRHLDVEFLLARESVPRLPCAEW